MYIMSIYVSDVKTPVCAVSGAQFLTRKGFLDLRNTLDADVPFKLFRDEGRTFLQVNESLYYIITNTYLKPRMLKLMK